jgi:hypothetical protein
MPLQLHIDNNGHWFVDTELGGVQVGDAYQQTDGSWVATVNECILEAPDLHSAMRIFADNYDRSLVQLSPMTDGDNWDCEEDEGEVTVINLSPLDKSGDCFVRIQPAEDFATTTAEAVAQERPVPPEAKKQPRPSEHSDERSGVNAKKLSPALQHQTLEEQVVQQLMKDKGLTRDQALKMVEEW